MRELFQTQNNAVETADDEKSERKGNSSFVPVPISGTVVPADVADIIAALEEAHGFAALSPAGRDNIEFAIEKLSALAAAEPSEPVDVAELKERNSILERLFEQQRKRSKEAGDLWRQAHPGNDLVSPDLGELLTWLMSQIATPTPSPADRGAVEAETTERVARAIYEAAQFDYEFRTINPDGEPYGEWKTAVMQAEAALAALALPAAEGDRLACPICAVDFQPADLCATDIEMGTCHAACLEGSPVVDLDTGEPSDGPIHTYRFDEDAGALAAPSQAREE